MLRLYGAARSRAVRTLWMLGELGLDYDHKDYLPRAPETRILCSKCLRAAAVAVAAGAAVPAGARISPDPNHARDVIGSVFTRLSRNARNANRR